MGLASPPEDALTEAAPTAHLAVDRLSRRYGPRWAVARVSFSLPRGASLLLLGPNGSGKTTLLRCLATALKPHEGQATLDGLPLWQERHQLRPHIAWLAHSSRLYADLSASQNLWAWARMGGLTPDVDALLDRVGLPHTGAKPVAAFSAGMRRRLALALVLMKRPRLALFDEPFTALDPSGQALLHDVLLELRACGTTLVITSHQPARAAPACTHALRLVEGRLDWRGTPQEALRYGAES